MALEQFFSIVARQTLRNTPIFVGALGTAGFIGARGDPRGIPAGVVGSVGGGTRGAFSGAIMGSMLGLGAIGAAMYSPRVGNVIGKMLHTLIRSSPVRTAGSILGASPVQAHRDMAYALTTFAEKSPVRAAAAFTESLLINKRDKLMQAAFFGGFGGALVGTPLGAMRSAYLGGRRINGPQEFQ